MNDNQIEQEIQAKGLTAPRVTPADIAANIQHTVFFTAAQGLNGAVRAGESDDFAQPVPALGLLTFCVLVLRNGFTVTGESACASPENFDAEIGKKIARENAINKVWPLMGYALKQELHAAVIPPQPPQDNAHVAPGCEKFALLPHQQRVVDEKRDLNEKLSKLGGFLDTPYFGTLAGDEQNRMREQYVIMQSYAAILDERIEAF